MFCIALAWDAAKQTNTLQVLPTSEPSASVLLEYLSIALRVRLTEAQSGKGEDQRAEHSSQFSKETKGCTSQPHKKSIILKPQ